jgi:hypothetical protein
MLAFGVDLYGNELLSFRMSSSMSKEPSTTSGTLTGAVDDDKDGFVLADSTSTPAFGFCSAFFAAAV